MKKRISTNLVLYFNNLFPYKNRCNSSKRNRVTIGIGGNIGDTNKIFKKLFLMLQTDARFSLLETSPTLQNPPFGYLEQNDFLNAVVVLKTDLSAFECLRVFQRYEKRFKRKRSFKDAPRTLDIDILFFNQQKIDTKRLTIPHRGYKERMSVLIPLQYLKIKNNLL